MSDWPNPDEWITREPDPEPENPCETDGHDWQDAHRNAFETFKRCAYCGRINPKEGE